MFSVRCIENLVIRLNFIQFIGNNAYIHTHTAHCTVSEHLKPHARRHWNKNHPKQGTNEWENERKNVRMPACVCSADCICKHVRSTQPVWWLSQSCKCAFIARVDEGAHLKRNETNWKKRNRALCLKMSALFENVSFLRHIPAHMNLLRCVQTSSTVVISRLVLAVVGTSVISSFAFLWNAFASARCRRRHSYGEACVRRMRFPFDSYSFVVVKLKILYRPIKSLCQLSRRLFSRPNCASRVSTTFLRLFHASQFCYFSFVSSFSSHYVCWSHSSGCRTLIGQQMSNDGWRRQNRNR